MKCAICSRRVRVDRRAMFGVAHVPDRGFRGHYAITPESREALAWERSELSRRAA